MARKNTEDKNQMALPGFEPGHKKAVAQTLEKIKSVDADLKHLVTSGPARPDVEHEYELSQEIAVAVKQELRESGISRESFCDRVNAFLGRSDADHGKGLCRKPLTKATLDKMISNPAEYPIYSFYLFAFQHVLGGFGVLNTIAAAKGARVVSQEDQKLLALARMGDLKTQIQLVEKEFKK